MHNYLTTSNSRCKLGTNVMTGTRPVLVYHPGDDERVILQPEDMIYNLVLHATEDDVWIERVETGKTAAQYIADQSYSQANKGWIDSDWAKASAFCADQPGLQARAKEMHERALKENAKYNKERAIALNEGAPTSSTDASQVKQDTQYRLMSTVDSTGAMLAARLEDGNAMLLVSAHPTLAAALKAARERCEENPCVGISCLAVVCPSGQEIAAWDENPIEQEDYEWNKWAAMTDDDEG